MRTSLRPGVAELLLRLVSLPLLLRPESANGFEGGIKGGTSLICPLRNDGASPTGRGASGSVVADLVRLIEGSNVGLGAGIRRVDVDVSSEYVVWCAAGELTELDVLRSVGDSRLCDRCERGLVGVWSEGKKGFGEGGNWKAEGDAKSRSTLPFRRGTRASPVLFDLFLVIEGGSEGRVSGVKDGIPGVMVVAGLISSLT